jgi:lauroyl/myristoyl acyltransferase
VLLPLLGFQAVVVMNVPMTVLLKAARLRGSIDYRLRHKSDRLRKQLSDYFGPGLDRPAIGLICRRYFQFRRQFYISRAWVRRRDFGKTRFEFSGSDHLDHALEGGYGAILLTTHLGYGRLLRYLLKALGYDAVEVRTGNSRAELAPSRARRYAESHLPPLRDFGESYDLRTGLNIRPILKALSENRIVIMTADSPYTANSVSVAFLGKKRRLAGTSVTIARATGAPILPVFVVDQNGRLDSPSILMKAPLAIPAVDTLEEVAETLQSFARIVESVILEYPHLYQWARRKYYAEGDGTVVRRRKRQARIPGEPAPTQ